MKRYTDKEFSEMTPEELEALQKKALQEFYEAGEKLERLLENSKKVIKRNEERNHTGGLFV